MPIRGEARKHDVYAEETSWNWQEFEGEGEKVERVERTFRRDMAHQVPSADLGPGPSSYPSVCVHIPTIIDEREDSGTNRVRPTSLLF